MTGGKGGPKTGLLKTSVVAAVYGHVGEGQISSAWVRTLSPVQDSRLTSCANVWR